MKIKRSSYFGALGRESLYEISMNADHSELILFIHGFMGFMDWGSWHLVSDYFTQNGFDFCRFNHSHNGCTIDKPSEFLDFGAFQSNTYSKELADIDSILNHIAANHKTYDKIHLIGHSRGGAMAILAAHHWKEHGQLGQICTWAAISDIERRFPVGNELIQWQKSGVRYIENGRTLQELPQLFEIYTDYIENKTKLDVIKAAKSLADKLHVFHGSKDLSVPKTEAFELASVAHSQAHIIEGADHVFGSRHPWKKKSMPEYLQKLCQHTLYFLKMKKAS